MKKISLSEKYVDVDLVDGHLKTCVWITNSDDEVPDSFLEDWLNNVNEHKELELAFTITDIAQNLIDLHMLTRLDGICVEAKSKPMFDELKRQFQTCVDLLNQVQFVNYEEKT